MTTTPIGADQMYFSSCNRCEARRTAGSWWVVHCWVSDDRFSAEQHDIDDRNDDSTSFCSLEDGCRFFDMEGGGPSSLKIYRTLGAISCSRLGALATWQQRWVGICWQRSRGFPWFSWPSMLWGCGWGYAARYRWYSHGNFSQKLEL